MNRYKLTARDGTTRILSREELEKLIHPVTLRDIHEGERRFLGSTAELITLYTPADALRDAAPAMLEALKDIVQAWTAQRPRLKEACGYENPRFNAVDRAIEAARPIVALAEHGPDAKEAK